MELPKKKKFGQLDLKYDVCIHWSSLSLLPNYDDLRSCVENIQSVKLQEATCRKDVPNTLELISDIATQDVKWFTIDFAILRTLQNAFPQGA